MKLFTTTHGGYAAWHLARYRGIFRIYSIILRGFHYVTAMLNSGLSFIRGRKNLASGVSMMYY